MRQWSVLRRLLCAGALLALGCGPALAAVEAAAGAPAALPAQAAAGAAVFDDAALAAAASGLAGDFSARVDAIEALGLSGRDEAARLLAALADGSAGVVDGRVVRVEGDSVYAALGDEAVSAAAGEVALITLNNRLRQTLAQARATLTLTRGDLAARRAAATTLADNPTATLIPVFERALQSESDADVRTIVALAAARLQLDAPAAERRLAAARTLGEAASPAVRNLLAARLEQRDGQWVEPDAAVRAAAAQSVRAIERRIATAQTVGTVFSGVSLGSILLLAALGLAITYGVMGVINMAHGELLMVGAYATFVVQGVFRSYFPAWLDWYVVAAIPVAFFAAALVGMAMERLVLRHLYGRPLESLLATWGLSLVLIQAARVSFGPQNLELANPAWMSGGLELAAGVVLPYNRIVIIGFAVFVLVLIWLMMQKTRLGMFVRAVTQNRAMAGCVGVPTARVDTLAFAIGSGVAGLGGLALSQIANVGPAMGTGYIVDAFMVVVLGGVGQLAGAVWAALGLGIAAKFLEGWAGAVVAKILVLVFIIAFIQKRPQGIFALKGRFADN